MEVKFYLATRNFVPRETNDGSLGTDELYWKSAYINDIYAKNIDVPRITDIESDVSFIGSKLSAVEKKLPEIATSLDKLSQVDKELSKSISTKVSSSNAVFDTYVNGVTPLITDDSTKFATTEYVSKLKIKARTFYVSSDNGDDANDGSKEKPFRTLQKAIDNCGSIYIGTTSLIDNETPCDKIEVATGTYNGAIVGRKSVFIYCKEKLYLTDRILVSDSSSLTIKCKDFVSNVPNNDAIKVVNNSQLTIDSETNDINSNTHNGITVLNNSSVTLNGVTDITGNDYGVYADNNSSVILPYEDYDTIHTIVSGLLAGVKLLNNSRFVANSQLKILKTGNYGIYLENNSIFTYTGLLEVYTYSNQTIYLNGNCNLIGRCPTPAHDIPEPEISTIFTSAIKDNIVYTDINLYCASSDITTGTLKVDGSKLIAVKLDWGSTLTFTFKDVFTNCHGKEIEVKNASRVISLAQEETSNDT